MYEDHFGFERAPFNNVPDTDFFFSSARHAEALSQLYYTVVERKGFAVLTGEIGSGKTTVTRALLRRLESSTVTAVITNSRLTGVQLLWSIAREFGIEVQKASRPELLEAINQFLIGQLAKDKNVLVLIDEAQDLPLSTLEEVRLVSNLETEREKLIQIILVGQPELRASIDHPELKQLRQRIALRFHLAPLDVEEMRSYIEHRLRVAGPANRAKFTDRAYHAIFRYSKGTPRLINLCCEKALLVAYTQGETKIDQKSVMDGLRDLEGEGFTFQAREKAEADAQKSAAPRKPFIRMPFLGGKYR